MVHKRSPRRRGDAYGAHVEGSAQHGHHTTLDPVAARLGFGEIPLWQSLLAIAATPIVYAVMWFFCAVAQVAQEVIG